MPFHRPLRVSVRYCLAVIIGLAVILSISSSSANASAKFTWKARPNTTSGLRAGVTVRNAATANTPEFTGSFPAGQAISKTEYPKQIFLAGHITAVADPTSSVGVAKYSMGPADEPYAETYASRGDLLTPNLYTNGSTSFTSIPVKIPAGLPPIHNTASSFFQFAEAKDTAASAPGWGLGLFADSSGKDHYFFGGTNALGSYGQLWLGPVVDGAWHTFTVDAKYSTTTNGFVSLYMDGKLQTFNLGPNAGKTVTPGFVTITDGASAWPLDINSYRSDGTIPGTFTLYHGAPEIGPTLASVSGGSTTTGTLQAAFTGPTTSTTGQTDTFDASTSTGSPLSYAWTDGTQKLGTGATLSFTFHYTGVKHVTLTATNASGQTSTVEHDLTVSAAHLKAAFTGPATSQAGKAVTFDASSSTGSPTSYTWTDANGNASLGTGKTMPFTFQFAGTKKVTLTEKDATGASATVEHDLVVS
jgi:Polysaccharide lyase/PKD domain